jgi:hypothetical protein
MVAYTCNPTYAEVGDQEDHSSRPIGQKVCKTLLQSISQAWWGMPVIQAM